MVQQIILLYKLIIQIVYCYLILITKRLERRPLVGSIHLDIFVFVIFKWVMHTSNFWDSEKIRNKISLNNGHTNFPTCIKSEISVVIFQYFFTTDRWYYGCVHLLKVFFPGRVLFKVARPFVLVLRKQCFCADRISVYLRLPRKKPGHFVDDNRRDSRWSCLVFPSTRGGLTGLPARPLRYTPWISNTIRVRVMGTAWAVGSPKERRTKQKNRYDRRRIEAHVLSFVD